MNFEKFDDWYKGDHEQIRDLFKLLMRSVGGVNMTNEDMFVQLDDKGNLIDVMNQMAIDAFKEREE